MYRLFTIATLTIILSAAGVPAFAQNDEPTGLCPSPFFEAFVNTGSVDCFSTTRNRSNRDQTEEERIELEAICNATPNSEVSGSQTFATSSGRFFASVTCTVQRPVPAGTVLCPGDSEEQLRAFDTLICMYSGKAVSDAIAGQALLDTQAAECTAANGGRVLDGRLLMGMVDEIAFMFTQSTCALTIVNTGVYECPFGYSEDSRDEDMIVCERNESSFATIEEANEANALAQTICTGTTDGLGKVSESMVGASTSSSTPFFTEVECTVGIPRLTIFTDNAVSRACDATCTTDIEQTRTCLNGGRFGQPGCVGDSTRLLTRRCNTGLGPDGLCPATGNPSILPLLLEDDEEEEPSAKTSE